MTAPHAAGPATLTRVDHVQEAVREAAATRAPLRVAGAGTWLGAGRAASRHARMLSIGGLAGIIEYTPGDLTLTARAGTTLAEIAVATAVHGQWLALDPYGSDAGTIGATIATGSAGPLAHAFGQPRDAILGMEIVTGDGECVRGGGRVVKNVAGFDLTRLMTGAWGTLGVITEVTVRLRARPAADTTVAITTPSGQTAALGDWLRRPPIATVHAAAVELVNGALARHLGLADAGVPGHPVLLVRLAESAALVGAELEALAKVGTLTRVPTDIWSRLRACEPDDAVVFRLSRGRAQIADTWRDAAAFAADAPGAFVHASVGRGVARCVLPHPDPVALGAGFARHPATLTIVAERLPAPLWSALRSAVGDRLSRGVKRAFDPHDILNPGILGEGGAA